MEVYVIYAMSDYDYSNAGAIALTTDKGAAEAEADRLFTKGLDTYIEKVEVNDGITDLLND